MKNKLVAIHQPNFFPWLGYFDKLARADVFIVLDDAYIQKTGSTWVNRVRLLVSGRASWFSAPVVRESGYQRIGEVRLDEHQPWRKKLVRMLEINYRRAAFYEETMGWLLPLIENPEQGIAAYNVAAIVGIADKIGISTGGMALSSDYAVSAKGTDRLIELTRAVGGTVYLCGGGASGYQEDSQFGKEEGVHLCYQNFCHPEYPQHGAERFVPGLSIIDALMNVGSAGVAHLLAPGGLLAQRVSGAS